MSIAIVPSFIQLIFSSKHNETQKKAFFLAVAFFFLQFWAAIMIVFEYQNWDVKIVQ